MTVDLTKLKAGDSVKLHCGGVLQASSVGLPTIMFKDYDTSLNYFVSGNYRGNETHPLDIIEIIPAPFDWSKVEQGDAFEEPNGNTVYFIANDYLFEGCVFIVGEEREDKPRTAHSYEKDWLTPRPDIPNAKK